MIIYSADAERRDRMLIAAVWLIGLGSLFMVKDFAGWEWSQAWPLILIYLGIAGGATSLLSRHGARGGLWVIWWPLAVVVIGAILLASTTGMIGLAPTTFVSWWPLVAIVLGVWFLVGAVIFRERGSSTETLSVPLDGVDHAEVRLHFGGGELVVGPAASGTLVSGTFEGGVESRQRGPGQIEIEPEPGRLPFLWDRPLRWNVALTGEVPLDLGIESGANRSSIDLSALRIRRLELKTGASETRIRLPANGATSVRSEAGVASVTLEVPAGVAARIRSMVALGSTSVDETRFPRSLDGWSSPDFETATNRVELELHGGLGSVKVR